MEEKKRRSWIIDVILVVLVIGLGYFLYTVIGGELTASDVGGELGPFEQITESLGAFGRGIRNTFGRMVP